MTLDRHKFFNIKKMLPANFDTNNINKRCSYNMREQPELLNDDNLLNRCSSDSNIKHNNLPKLITTPNRLNSVHSLSSSNGNNNNISNNNLSDADEISSCNSEEDEETIQQTITSLHTIIDKLSILFKEEDKKKISIPSSPSSSQQRKLSIQNAEDEEGQSIGLMITKIEPSSGLIDGNTKVVIHLNANTNEYASSSSLNNEKKKSNTSSLIASYKVLFGRTLIDPIQVSDDNITFLTPSSTLRKANSVIVKLLDLDNEHFITSDPPISFTYISDSREQQLSDLAHVKQLYQEKGLDLLNDKCYENGQTAIHVAFRLAQLEVVKYLVLQSDQFDCLVQTDDQGNTPFDIAMSHKHYLFLSQVIDWLKQVVKNKLQHQQQLLLQQQASTSPIMTTPPPTIITTKSNLSTNNNITPNTANSSQSSLTEQTSNSVPSPRDESSQNELTPISSSFPTNSTSFLQSEGSFSLGGLISSFTNFGNATIGRKPHKRIATSGTVLLNNSMGHRPTIATISELKGDDDYFDDEGTASAGSSSTTTPIKVPNEEKEIEATQNLIAKYRIDQFRDIVLQKLVNKDILLERIIKKLESGLDPKLIEKIKEISDLPFISQKSFLEEIQLERRANPFKPSIYFDEEVDEEYSETALLLSHFFEESLKQLPFYVLSAIQTMSSDFVIVGIRKNVIDSKAKEPNLNYDLASINYEIDLLYRKKGERKDKEKKKLQHRSADVTLSLEPTTPVEEAAVDVDLIIPDEKKIVPLEGLQDKDFLLTTFEDIYPCEDQEKQLGIVYDDTKLLYSEFEWIPSHIDPTNQYLFEFAKFDLEVNSKFETPVEEVYYISIALYMVTDSDFKKISEDVEIKISSSQQDLEETINHSRAMFSLLKSSEDKVVVLFKFFRKFRGELTDTLNDFYIQKPEKVKQSDVKKYLTKNEKLSSFPFVGISYSIFAWSAVHLKDCVEKSEIVLRDIYLLPKKCPTGDTTLLQNYMDLIEDFEDRDKNYMKKALVGSFAFSLKELPPIAPIPRHYHPNSHELVIKLDSKHMRVKQVPNLEHGLLTKILPLSSELIIYPQKLTLGKREYKNIVCKVTVIHEKERQKPMKVFYDKFSTNPDRESRVHARYTTISVGNRNPEFCDEFKCIIPCSLTSQHVLLFEFFNVLHKESLILKNHRDDTQKIGYSYLRLLAEQKIANGRSVLDVFAEKKENNVTRSEKIEGAQFEVLLYPRSIAFPTDENLSSFFIFLDNFQRKSGPNRAKKIERNFFEELTTRELHTSLPGLKELGSQYVAYAPVILNQLFCLYFDVYDEESQAKVFETIIEMLDKYRTEHRTIVPGWIKFQFTSVFQDYVFPSLHMIAKSICNIMEKKEFDSRVIKNAAYIFSILLKAMVVHLDYMRTKKQEENYDFSPQFYDIIRTLTVKSFRNLLARNISETRSVNIINTTVIFAQFLKSLLTIMDKPFVMNLIALFVELLPLIIPGDKKAKNTVLECVSNLQMLTYKEVFSYDHYLQLYLPESMENILKNQHLPSIDGIHFLFSSFVDIAIKNILSPIKEIRISTSVIFRELIYKLSLDGNSLFFSPVTDMNERIHLMHFEFLEKFLDVILLWRNEVDKDMNTNKKNMNDCKKGKIVTEQQLAAKKENLKSKENALTGAQLESVNKEIHQLDTKIKQLESMINRTKEELKNNMNESFKEKRQLVVCLFHILKNVNKEYFTRWLKETTPSRRVGFLLLLQLMLQAFEYQCEEYYSTSYNSMYSQVKKQPQVLHSNSGNSILNTSFTLHSSSSSAPTMKDEKDKMNEFKGTSPISINISAVNSPINNSSSQSLSPSNSEPTIVTDITSPRRSSMSGISITPELLKTGNSLKKKTTKQGLLSRFMHTTKLFESQDPQFKDSKEYSSLKIKRSERTRSIKLETSKTSYIAKCIGCEQHWSREVSNYVFELLIHFLDNILDDGNDAHLENSSIMENVVRTFLNFLRLTQPEDVLINVLTYLKVFFSKHYRVLLDEETNTQYPTLFCECLMFLCNSDLVEVRRQATSCLYLLIRYLYIINCNTILKPQVLTTLALSKTLQRTGNLDNKEYSPLININYLKEAIDAIGKYAYLDPHPPTQVNNQQDTKPKTEDNSTKKLSTLDAFFRKMEQRVKMLSAMKEKKEESTFAEEVNTQVCKKLQSLLQDTTSVKATLLQQDVHKTEDLFLRISQVYTRIPELRFVWLNQLAGYHNKHSQYLEASQCYLTILSIVFDQLKATNSTLLKGIPIQLFQSISPLKRRSSNTSRGSMSINVNDCFISHQAIEFTEHGILHLLTKTVECLEFAEFFETAIFVEKLTLPILERIGDYNRMSQSYHTLQSLCERLKKLDRLEPFYYKVQLVNFPEKNNADYIYKMPKLFKLYKMNKWCQDKFGGSAPVEVISGSKPVTIDPTKRYVFLTPVKPLMKSVKPIIIGNQKLSKYEGNIRKFYFETAYGKSTKITEARKRKVIITTSDYFPSVKTRLPIESEEEIVLSPIEAAIENIDQQIQKLKEALVIPGDEDPDISQIKVGGNVDLSNLQLVLQGSIRANVNGGPRDIVEGFLKVDQRHLYSLEHVLILNRKCHVFLKLCEEAVRIENQLMDKATERAFHQEMEKALVETQQLFSDHLTPLGEIITTPPSSALSPQDENEANQRRSVIGDIPVIRNFRLSMPTHELSQLGLSFPQNQEMNDDEGTMTPRDFMN